MCYICAVSVFGRLAVDTAHKNQELNLIIIAIKSMRSRWAALAARIA
jgi:hypothetical protein